MARKNPVVTVIGSSWIKRKAKEAKNGDAWALEVLTDTYYREVKRANQRARELDKRGINSAAKTAFRNAIPEGLFLSQSKKLDVDTMVKNLDIAEKLLKADTSTVTGAKRAFNKSINTMREKGFISKSEGMSDAEYKKQLTRFFKNKHFEELKKFLGSGIIKDASDAISAGIPIGRINRLFNEYLKNPDEHDVYEVWETFTTGEKHL